MNRKHFLQTLAGTAAVSSLVREASGQNSRAQPASKTLDASAPLPPEAWTLVTLPDTQFMTLRYPEVHVAQTEWIVANQGRYNIRFVAHEGDIVDCNTHPEWSNARRALDNLLHAKIPFSLLPGNHDLGRWGKSTDRGTLLNDYFTFWDYANSEKVGYFEARRMENSWHRLTTPTGKFLVLALEFGPRDPVLDWANKVVAENADREVIVVTHAYLYSDSTRYDWKQKGTTQTWNPRSYAIAKSEGGANDAEEMWSKFVSRHANIRFVLCGHVLHGGTGYLASPGAHGNVVHQILANYQTGTVPDRGFGGAGILRLMHFLPDRTVRVRTYSPWLEQWLTEPEHQFSLTL